MKRRSFLAGFGAALAVPKALSGIKLRKSKEAGPPDDAVYIITPTNGPIAAAARKSGPRRMGSIHDWVVDELKPLGVSKL